MRGRGTSRRGQGRLSLRNTAGGRWPWGPWLVPKGGEHVSVEIVGAS